MSISKKTIGVAIVILICLGAGYCKRQAYKLEPFEMFRAQEGGFSVLFPGKPKRQEGSLFTPQGDIEFVWYSAGSRLIQFAVRYGDYPQEAVAASDPEEILTSLVEHLVRNINGQLLGQSATSFHGYPARQFEAEAVRKKKEFTIRMKLILVENRIYWLLVASRSADVIDKHVRKFFDSFSVDGVE